MKLPKIVDGDHEKESTLISKLRQMKDGTLPNPGSVKWTNNFSNIPELTFPEICNYLVGKSDYDLKSLSYLIVYKYTNFFKGWSRTRLEVACC